ncbi:coiled-coil domain-containing protein 94 [Powellomyces hirtus]|nr:coiled-coil domain-containing protein 94 [Powellomyces hirtus]
MSERKVLNKYFPPDFDPSKIPRRKLPKDQQHKVRLMTPFSMQCTICGEYVYKGKKFNARKERVDGEDYLGIQVFRFYIRCPRCSGEITFKTDPQKADYVAEHGAVRNFEPWRDDDDATEAARASRAAAEENNPMAALENRTLDSKREMDILDALDEIRMRNAKTERVDSDAVLDNLIQDSMTAKAERQRLIDEEDERVAKAVFFGIDGEAVKRIEEEDEDEDAIALLKKLNPELDSANDSFLKNNNIIHSKTSSSGATVAATNKRKQPTAADFGILVKKKKPASPPAGSTTQPSSSSSLTSSLAAAKPPIPPPAQKPSALSLLGGTYSDTDSDQESD